MPQLSYRRHRFPAEIIQHAIWLYLRFTLSYRDVEELLVESAWCASRAAVLLWFVAGNAASAQNAPGIGTHQLRQLARFTGH
jgi:putative transposase